MSWLLFTLLSAVADGFLVKRVGKRFVGVDPETLGGLTTEAQTIEGAKTFSSPVVVEVDDDGNGNTSDSITLRHTTSGTPGPGIGAAVMFEAEGGGGVVLTGGIVGELTTVTDGSEVGRLGFYPAVSGAPRAGLRIDGVAGAVNGIALSGGGGVATPTLAVYGSDANAGLKVMSKGTGVLTFTGGDGSAKFQVSNAGLGFFGAPVTAQPTAITDANGFTLAGSDQVDAANLLAWLNQNTTKLNAVIAALRTLGIIAT